MRTFLGRFCAGLIAIGLLVNAGNAALATEKARTQTPTVQDVATVIGENAIHYPQLSGMADEKNQQSINDAIVEKANIAQRMVTLSTLQAGGSGLQVTYKAYLEADIFSTVISAKGILENGRNGQVYTALNFDLQTGTPLSISDLFTDTDAAVAAMEQILQSTYLEELSSYMENSDLTPLPTEQFSLDANGITFYYPYRQFALLSGYSGAAQFAYHVQGVSFEKENSDTQAGIASAELGKVTDGKEQPRPSRPMGKVVLEETPEPEPMPDMPVATSEPEPQGAAESEPPEVSQAEPSEPDTQA